MLWEHERVADARTVALTTLIANGLYLVMALEAGGSRRRSTLVAGMCAVMAGLYVAALAFPAYWWARRRNWDWTVETPRLVAVSILAAPYGAWGFDLVVLLVPVVRAAARLVHAQPGRGVTTAFALGFLVLAAQGLVFARIERYGSLATVAIVAANIGLGSILVLLKLFVSH